MIAKREAKKLVRAMVRRLCKRGKVIDAEELLDVIGDDVDDAEGVLLELHGEGHIALTQVAMPCQCCGEKVPAFYVTTPAEPEELVRRMRRAGVPVSGDWRFSPAGEV